MNISDDDIIAESFSMTVQVQSSFVLMDQSTGYVLALSGGRGEKQPAEALTAPHSPPDSPVLFSRRLPFSFLL